MNTTENNMQYSSRDGYTAELGGHHFTEEQWEVISTYAKGYHMSQSRQSSRMQEGVEDFHRVMGHPVHHVPRALPEDRKAVRIELIREEFEELKDALAADDMVEQVDACVDILYVTLGLLVEMGVNASPVFEEVQASNMSKLGEDGKPIIAGPNDPDGVFEGRVKKGPNYFRPDISSLLLSGEADLGRDS